MHLFRWRDLRQRAQCDSAFRSHRNIAIPTPQYLVNEASLDDLVSLIEFAQGSDQVHRGRSPRRRFSDKLFLEQFSIHVVGLGEYPLGHLDGQLTHADDDAHE